MLLSLGHYSLEVLLMKIGTVAASGDATAKGDSEATKRLRAELQGLRMMALQRQASAEGVDSP